MRGARTIFVLIALASSTLLARTSAATDSGFAFLEIPTGARASALGGAYTSVAEGADAAFWNPAGLAAVRGVQVMGGHYELIQNLRHEHFVIARSAFGGGVSGSVRALYSGPIDERDEVGNLIGSFGVYDLELAAAYGHPIGAGVAAGGVARLLRERIADVAANTYAFDLGATWTPRAVDGLRLSLVAQNMGRDAHFTIDNVPGTNVPLPLGVQTGVTFPYSVTERMTLRGSFEGRFTRGRATIAMAGLELANPVGAAVRLGMRFNDETTSMSMGAGYALRAVRFDYAFVPMRLDLGDTHRVSFSAQF
jgi:hypothetical protein